MGVFFMTVRRAKRLVTKNIYFLTSPAFVLMDPFLHGNYDGTKLLKIFDDDQEFHYGL